MKRHKSQVQDFMSDKPLVITPVTSLFDAYNLMFENDIRRLPVVVEGELVGIVTLSDIQRANPLFREELDIPTNLALAPSRHVGEIMSREPVTVAPDDTIQDAAEVMLENEISGLPVVQDGHVVGIITESDIFKLIVDSWAQEG